MKSLLKHLPFTAILTLVLYFQFSIYNPLPAQTTAHAFTFGGTNREYRVFLPATYTGAAAVPLVFNLHGYTSNAFQQEFYSEMNAVADTAGFIVCYPDGLNNSWNSGFSGTYYGGVDDVGFISVLIDTLRANYNIDPARVYSCGMSNGGFMSYRLACDLESRIAAIASVTGSMTTLQLDNCQCQRPMPVLEIHGTNDPTVPYNTSALAMGVDSVLNYWRVNNACNGPAILDTLPDIVQEQSTVTTQWYQGCSANVEVAHFKVENGGHTWPGASFLIPGNNTNQDMEASVEIWKFFRRFSHSNPVLTGMGNAMDVPKPVVQTDPATESIRLTSLLPGAQVQMMDVQGRQMGSWQVNGHALNIAVAEYAAGIYMLHILQGGTDFYQKVLVE